MKIIVTGSEGFIGRELVKKLSFDNTVIHIDKKLGIDAVDIELYIEGVDVVYHLAAQTSVFNQKHDDIMYDNFLVFTKICDVCEKYNVKLVYASSSCAYNITSLYGMSKRFNEKYAAIYNDNATGVRLHNVIGKNQRQGTLLYNLMYEKCKIYNNGNNKRHFTYIDDVVNGLIFASTSHEKLLNVVNPLELSVNDFITEIKKYRDIHNIEYTADIREYDNEFQYVDNDIPTININYTTVENAIKNILKY